MVHVEFSRRAALTLSEIERFSIKEWGPKVTSKYIDAFNHAIERLIKQPSLLRDWPEASATFKFYRVEKHLLVCDVIDKNIYIVTVLHGSMDLPSVLSELEPKLLDEAELLHRSFLASLKTSKKKRPKK